MNRAIILAAALVLGAGCYKTTYRMNPSGADGMPSQEYNHRFHFSVIGLVEISSPVDMARACQGGPVASIDERVSVLGGIVNLVLGTYIPILSVRNATVNCGGGQMGPAPMGPAPMPMGPAPMPMGEPPPAQ